MAKKKRVLTILLTAILFLSAAFLTVVSVYRVNHVSLRLSTISEEAKVEGEELQKILTSLYQKDNIFGAKEHKGREAFENYPHFRFSSFKKEFPNRLIFTAVEDPEVYAVEGENGYSILNGDGALLCVREGNINRCDNAPNVLFKGFVYEAERGEVSNDYAFLSILSFCQNLDEKLNGIRNNVLAVEWFTPTSNVADGYIRVHMKEGVIAQIYDPINNTKLKADHLFELYTSLSVEDRMRGCIYVAKDGKTHYED